MTKPLLSHPYMPSNLQATDIFTKASTRDQSWSYHGESLVVVKRLPLAQFIGGTSERKQPMVIGYFIVLWLKKKLHTIKSIQEITKVP